ncbi:hypothetical protein MKK69_08030 [Methylobacterium sp. J-026]|uniref:hypothetical protein n=1 Tax=Methylobacterium sp. J-026 TaxID=2836624 RepID=UPI001FB927A0|nr:hypothetical protein [Methylobacterium sp. J-026]MCJ2134013.1 hypothetical protein [Methylobacterium sp. J-026]
MAEASCDPKDVALAALTNLIRLMGAELVAGRHRDDIAVFERAVRAKVGAVEIADCPTETVRAGLALASAQVEQALERIRRQAQSTCTPALPRGTPGKTAGSPFLH